jgi:glucose-6-phosphate isomerase
MLPYRQDIDSIITSNAAYQTAVVQSARALKNIQQHYETSSLPLLRLPEQTSDLTELEDLAAQINAWAKTVVVLGTGGSSLGGQTLYQLVDKGFGNQTGAPKVFFLDNVDPHTFDDVFKSLALETTCFIAISKSGNTAETLSQLLVVLERLDDLGLSAKKHVIALTENKANSLRQIADALGLKTLEHDPNVGGRFSVLSNTGLLPALIAGVDVRQVRLGALGVLQTALQGNANDCLPTLGASAQITSMTMGKSISVLMPYIDSLGYFGFWYRQLWAESLGKNGKGSTPVRAMGTVDQHSQLQLYLDGAADKFFTVLVRDSAGEGAAYHEIMRDDARLNYLWSSTMGDLLLAEATATIKTIEDKKMPVRTMRLGTVDAFSMGALLMHFMLETIIAADLLGVNAFDQPAVEQGKILTREYLLARTRAA